MSKTVRIAMLLSSEADNTHRTENDVNRGDLIEELKDDIGNVLIKNGFTKIKNLTSNEEGWVPTDEIMEFDPGIGTESIEQTKFAFACVKVAQFKGINGASLIAVAWVHRKDNWEEDHKGKIKITGDLQTGFGAFNYSQVKWDRLVLKHGVDEGIRQGDIVHPFRQCIFAAIEAQTALTIVREKLNRVPLPIDYCLHHILGSNFHKVESEAQNKKINTFISENTIKDDGTKDKELTEAILKGNDHILKEGNDFRTIKSFIDNLEENLDKALQERVILLFAEIPDFTRLVEIPGGARSGTTSPEFGKLEPLIKIIVKGESKGNYEAFIGNIGNDDRPRLTTMSLDDVRAFQKTLVAGGKPSSAVGRYQIINGTLISLISDLNLAGSDIFNESLQDRMAEQLLNRRGLQAYLNSPLTTKTIETFALSLAKEWAALPVPKDVRGRTRHVKKGQSYYAGDGVNKAQISLAEILTALQQIKA